MNELKLNRIESRAARIKAQMVAIRDSITDSGRTEATEGEMRRLGVLEHQLNQLTAKVVSMVAQHGN